MNAPILVTYTTRYGSTQEVAESIAATLRQHGLDVDLQPMHDVTTLEPYKAVVFGAPLYIGRWPRDAHNFLARHRDALVQRPLMLFTLGPTQPDTSKWADVRSQFALELANYPWLHPVESELFGGAYDPAKLRFPDSLLAKLPVSPLHQMPASDARDWQAIHAWAEKIIMELQPA